jgi:hypothetical protein
MKQQQQVAPAEQGTTQQSEHPLSFVTAVISASSVVYLTIFSFLLLTGGVETATSFLGSIQSTIAPFLLGTVAVLASILLGAQKALAPILFGALKVLTKVIETTGVQLFLVLYILVNISGLLVVGLLFDRELTFATLAAITRALSQAIPAVWQTFSNPKVILAHGFFIMVVSISTQVPDAFREALMKSQKLRL